MISETKQALITDIVVKLSPDDFVDTGSGMGTLWKYPEACRELIPVPLARLTIFDPSSITAHGRPAVTPCRIAVVEAVVSHHAHGIMKATSVNIVYVIEH